MYVKMTFAPFFANAIAVADPIPLLPPVMRTVFFWFMNENSEQYKFLLLLGDIEASLRFALL